MTRRTRAELEAENLVLYRELEAIRDRLDELLTDDESFEGTDDTDGDDEEPDAEDED